jgi:hypothetical protein
MATSGVNVVWPFSSGSAVAVTAANAFGGSYGVGAGTLGVLGVWLAPSVAVLSAEGLSSPLLHPASSATVAVAANT